MKKIIAAFDGLRFSASTLEEAISLAQRHSAHLVGVFLQEFVHTGFAVFEAVETQSYPAGKEMVDRLHRQDAADSKASVDLFEKSCREAGLSHSVHCDKNSALEDILHESIFADILLIDRHETFSSLEENIPGWFLKSLLHGVQCPVWLVSKKTGPVNRLVFLYDGDASSVYSMKMFTYLFPDMAGSEIQVLTFKSNTLDLGLPDNELVHEWMKRHYPRAVYKVVKGGPNELFTLLKEEGPDILVVIGAYERSRLSTWLLPSLADELMQKIKAPIFIAHS